MLRSLRRGASNLRRGASAVEFALVLTTLIPIVLLGTEVGWYLALRIMVEHCVRDGARTGAAVCNPANCDALLGGECSACENDIGDSPSDFASARFAQCWADTGFPGTAASTVTLAGTEASRDRRLTVSGTVTYTPIAATAFLPNPIRSNLTMRLDDQTL